MKWLYSIYNKETETETALFEDAITATICLEGIRKNYPKVAEKLKIKRRDGIPLSGFDF